MPQMNPMCSSYKYYQSRMQQLLTQEKLIDQCLVIIHTLKSLRPQLLLMTNERGLTPLIRLLSPEMTSTTNVVDEDGELETNCSN